MPRSHCSEPRHWTKSPKLGALYFSVMKLDETAAAYGLFQVVFADVADHLAVATFRLREQKEPELTFEAVFRQEFKTTLKQFRKELRYFERRSPVASSLSIIKESCTVAAKLANWRNERIHARVRMVENEGYALYDWRTRRRLEITKDKIERHIEQAIKAIVDLQAHLPELVTMLEWDAEVESLLSTIPELSEPVELDAEDEQ